MTVVVALDQGTTNTKALAIDVSGRVVAKASAPVGITTPAAGSVEQDAEEIWTRSVDVLARCIDEAGASSVVGLAIANQRESVVAWDRSTGAPTGPVLSWQDSRTAEWCATLGDAQTVGLVQGRTGLPLDPMFSAPKMAWVLRDADPSTVVGTVDSWLLWNLTGSTEHVIEAGNASRTLLYRLDKLCWDDDLLALFGIRPSALPEPRRSHGPFGRTACEGLPRGLPVLAVLADSHAALRGHGGGTPGIVKATYGTGSSVMRGTGSDLEHRQGIATTLAWLDESPTYALEGNIRYSGSALEWTARMLGLPGAVALGELAAQVPHAGDVAFVPAFGGLGAPHWDPSAVGTITGLGARSTPAHVARAAFDAVAHQVADVVQAMVADTSHGRLRADGGATASRLLMQTQADVLGCQVDVAATEDMAAYGAARAAFSSQGVEIPPAPAGGLYVPRKDSSDRDRARTAWARAVARARY
ncbi:glycerol kinase [Isoptericola variabilis]|uniref:ATP:glycerol 3-phosphotransferase n=1 Tax=Isoptericola variabilis (strain 225) TaxID=743718 RepID=F6FW07_ISOV2|nr:FGGY family carbohydrate kinase [Isoptericola variabilis]AEG44477.1 Glycerol kinase [Isoptericola variabilis 225]TWH26610.1 glycerol kinase [Isoptericola variabilis J7]